MSDLKVYINGQRVNRTYSCPNTAMLDVWMPLLLPMPRQHSRRDPNTWIVAGLLTAGLALVVRKLAALWRSTA